MDDLCDELELHNVPFLVGGLGDFLENCTLDEKLKNYSYLNKELDEIAQENPMVGYVSAKGLGANPDNLHFNSQALYQFGLRYFDEFEKFKRSNIKMNEIYHEDNMNRTEMELL